MFDQEVIKFVNDVPDDVLLVMDEAYIEFLDDAVDLVPLIRLGVRKNLILMRTFSKIYGLAGATFGNPVTDGLLMGIAFLIGALVLCTFALFVRASRFDFIE